MYEQIRGWFADPTTGKLLSAALVIVFIYTFSHLARRSATRSIEDTNTRYRVRKAITFTGYLLTIIAIAVVFSDRLTSLTVALGVAGAGVAFALQEVIASAAGWIAVSFGKFYAPGDRIKLGGIKGDVIDIGVLRTTLMEIGEWVDGDLYNGRIVRVANSYVFKDPVVNYSADLPFLWDEITLPVRYGSDWQLARTMLVGVLNEVCGETVPKFRQSWKLAVKKYALEDARIDPMVTIVANDNWIQFTARYIVDYRSRRLTKDRIFTRILEEVDRSNNRIRLASATFEVVGVPPLTVNVEGSTEPARPRPAT